MDGKKLEIVQISEREYWVGRNKTFLIENNILHVVASGEQTKELAMLQFEIDRKLSSLVERKINYLIDLNNAGKNSPEARSIWTKTTENENTNKVAIYGLSPVARVLASFVMGVTKKKDIRFFITKEDALNWIIEENPKNNQE